MYTVLFADDDAAIRSLCCSILRCHGYSVLEAADGVDALWIAEGAPGPIHLLITDINMPRMGGKELWAALAACHPEAGVLFISGNLESVQGVDAPFQRKPFLPSALLSSVSAILAKQEVPLAAPGLHSSL